MKDWELTRDEMVAITAKAAPEGVNVLDWLDRSIATAASKKGYDAGRREALKWVIDKCNRGFSRASISNLVESALKETE